MGHFTQISRLASKTKSTNWLWSIWTTPSLRISSSQSSYSSSSSWMTDSTLLASSCSRAVVVCARFIGTLRISTFIHEQWQQLSGACEFAIGSAVYPLWWCWHRQRSVVVHGHLVVARQQFLPSRPPRQNVNEPRWLDNADRQILIDLLAVATDAALRLKHRDEKWIVGCFLFAALARAHHGRVVVLQRITDEIDDELQLRQVGQLGDLWVQVRRNDHRFLH